MSDLTLDASALRGDCYERRRTALLVAELFGGDRELMAEHLEILGLAVRAGDRLRCAPDAHGQLWFHPDADRPD